MTTPLMNLDLPVVSVTAGPLWATMLNAAQNLIDSHDHTSGKGSKVPTAGILINANLEMNSFDLTEIHALALDNLSATLGASLVGRLYQVNKELYYNDGNGTAVKMTNAGAVNVSGSNGIGGDYGGGNPASLNFVEATSTYEFYENASSVNRGNILFRGLDMSGRAAIASTALAGNLTITSTDDTFIVNVDTSAVRTITLPDPTLAKRLFIIKDVTGSADVNGIVIARFGSEQIDGVAANYTFSVPFGSLIISSNGTNWFVVNRNENYQRGTEVKNLGLTATVGSNALTFALKQRNGSDPTTGQGMVCIPFRHATLTNGQTNIRYVKSALSITIPSGATLGFSSAYDDFVYLYAIDNAGTVELAVSASALWAAENVTAGTVSTTLLDTASDDAGRIYSATQRSNVPCRMIGACFIAASTPGTWASSPSWVFVGDRVHESFNRRTAMVSGVSNINAHHDQIYIKALDATTYNIQLPIAQHGFKFTVKRSSGSASNNITIVRAGSENIDEAAASYVMSTSLQSATFFCDGTNWFVIS